MATPRSSEQPDTDTFSEVLAGGWEEPDVPVVQFSPGWPLQVSEPGRQNVPALVLIVVTDSAQLTHLARIACASELPVA